MKMHKSITEERVLDAIERDENLGFCIRCGAEIDGVELDARKHHCDVCGKDGIYGAQVLLFHVVR